MTVGLKSKEEKSVKLKKYMESLKTKNDEYTRYEMEMKNLKEELEQVARSLNIFDNFDKSTKVLYRIFSNMRFASNKVSLGFNRDHKKRYEDETKIPEDKKENKEDVNMNKKTMKTKSVRQPNAM
ncbi:hypothetical protein KI387_044765, partial [Taxus chinensis]